MPGGTAQLEVSISLADADPAEIQALTHELRAELLTLPVESVEPVAGGRAPEGTKGLDSAAVGQLALELSPVVVAAVFELLKLWAERRRELPLKIVIRTTRRGTHQLEYDPARTSPAELKAFINALGKRGQR
jgi:hypothetical protein